MATRIHRTLKVIECNANGIVSQRYELIKHLHDLHADVALCSETLLKPHKVELPLQLEKAFPTTL
jgi:hypothetical protein